MPLAGHIRELRGRLVKSALAIVAGAVVGFVFNQPITEFLKAPACDLDGVVALTDDGCVLVAQGIVGPFSFAMKIALMAGLVLAAPVWSYQLWAFLAPGLYKQEKRYAYAFVGAALPLFLGGAWLAYAILPKALELLLGFAPAGVQNLVSLEEYLDFVLRMVVVFGISFELPLLLVLLNLLGVLPASRLLGWWRGMVFGICVFAAVATPTGDPLTMTLLAGPLILLYLIATGLAWLNDRRRRGSDPYADLDDEEASPLEEVTTPVGAPAPVEDAPTTLDAALTVPDAVGPTNGSSPAPAPGRPRDDHPDLP